MEGAESDHSITWEDFFGSTTDLTPTLIGIYDSLLEPNKPEAKKNITQAHPQTRILDPKTVRPDKQTECRNLKIVENIAKNFEVKPLQSRAYTTFKTSTKSEIKSKDGSEKHSNNGSKICKIPGGIKLPLQQSGKSSLYSRRINVERPEEKESTTNSLIKSNENINASEKDNKLPNNDVIDLVPFENLSANVKRMISTADTSTNNILKYKNNTIRASARGHKSNIPLIGATSKICQSGVDILDSFEIHDQQTTKKTKEEIKLPPKVRKESPVKELLPQFRIDKTYDIPKNSESIYDVPKTKTAFESLSLPYIDQSIEMSQSCDREFDTKVKTPERSHTTEENHHKPLEGQKPPDLCNKSQEDQHNLSYLYSSQKKSPSKAALRSDGHIPSKESRLPRLEVTRPLSMSSIASSSSSSSGAQNKGVNSAYLASIESLDDHSDVDGSTKSSNNFVNSTQMLNSRSEDNDTRDDEEPCGPTQLEWVCAEIVETENVYVEDLRQVVEGYLHVWRENDTFSSDNIAELFINIEDIYAFNRSLCEALNTCQLDPISIAQKFVDNTSGFNIYTSYCTGYPQTMDRLASLASCPVGARECRDRQEALGHPLPLGSYLLKPVQRILKYHLLLQNLVKQCSSPETEYALLKMTAIAQHIDDMKRKYEHAVRVQEIQSLLYGWIGPDLTTYGELCAEGTFRVFGAKAMRHAFLFDKMLLFTKNREDGILAYKSHIMCNNLMLVESIAGAPLSFHVIPWDSPRAQLTLQARSQRHKREWTLLLKRVILENYNAVIPSHARQLVMELGQNKTDDDILAEKTRSLMTHSSIRKQLSVPEYLEKRKLERERRKTCENRLKPPEQPPTKCDCSPPDKGEDCCDICYDDLCSDCESEMKEKCPDCDKCLHFIDAGSADNLERKPNTCKCPDFKSSQESFVPGRLGSRGFHSTDNIVGYDKGEKVQRTCLKCAKIKENIALDPIIQMKSTCNDVEKTNTLRSKSREDSQRSKLPKISAWRRKSEPGLENGVMIPGISSKKSEEKTADVFGELVEFECRNCGSTRVGRRNNRNERDSDQGSSKAQTDAKSVEVRMYNSKHVPKKISKLRKNRAKGVRLGSDVTSKFYADLSDASTENVLHITESTDSINANNNKQKIQEELNHYLDIDEETYRKLVEKTDSFKKNELEKVKYLVKENVIKEAESESDKQSEPEKTHKEEESGEESEKPLEQIISQLLMQNREFQKILKKQQMRSGAQRRHQRLLKSHSNPEQPPCNKSKENLKLRPKYGRQTSEKSTPIGDGDSRLSSPREIFEDEHIYETLRVDLKPEGNSNLQKNTIQLLKIAQNRNCKQESDYVYLAFDNTSKTHIDDDGIYDVPSSIPLKKEETRSDYYVNMNRTSPDYVYDSINARAQSKDTNPSTGEYLPMNKDLPSPNAPEIWLTRQMEHFAETRDRKSGSLPRSFQVVTPQEDKELTTFKGRPNGFNKTYLNREGKVLSMDRPFTIASDKSELSNDNAENYMNEDVVLKYKNQNTQENEYLSKSTLELEEIIDRCYKNNFQKTMDEKNKNVLLDVQQNVSVNSSCELLSSDNQQDDSNQVHPEHKIYKPTTNFSIKKVLNRFKNKYPNKNSIDNSNENSPEFVKIVIKSPTSNDKRSPLNPRSYSKNLLQRFKNIIGDEQPEEVIISQEITSPSTVEVSTSNVDTKEVFIRTAESKPEDLFSKSLCEDKTKSVHDEIDTFHSCENISIAKQKETRPTFEQSISVSSTSSSPSRKRDHSLNKLPIYKQGSKHLGARIAQSDYVDPQTLCFSYKNNVNVLINKNSVRPDSLLSTSSFVTTSSEGNLLCEQIKTNTERTITDKSDVSPYNYESFYEKSFEQMDSVVDGELFRDSAVYSDQEETEGANEKTQQINVSKLHSMHRSASVKTEYVANVKAIEIKRNITSEFDNKPRSPPPVPVKPKFIQPVVNKSSSHPEVIIKTYGQSSPESTTVDQSPLYTSESLLKEQKSEPNTLLSKSESVKSEKQSETIFKTTLRSEFVQSPEDTVKTATVNSQSIQFKRVNFEKSCVGSASTKFTVSENKSEEIALKSILERRLEIEHKASTLRNLTRQIAKPKPAIPAQSSSPKSLAVIKKSSTSKNSPYHRNILEDKQEKAELAEKSNIPKMGPAAYRERIATNEKYNNETNGGNETSWVKTMVNKFQ